MKKVFLFFRASLAYLMAFGLVIMVPVAIIGMYPFAGALVGATGLQISPAITGGVVARKIPHGSWTTSIHEPVFFALIGKSKEGFVQVDWGDKKNLPERISEEIDYDGDGRADFAVDWNLKGGAPQLKALDPKVGPVLEHYELAQRYMLRVRLLSHP